MARQGRLDAPHRRRARARWARTRSSARTCRSRAAPPGRRNTGGTQQVAVCFFGDGTTNIGAFHEALNLAAVWKLPVVFVCENNLYMEYTPIGAVTAVQRSGGRPRGRLRPRADRRRRQRCRRGAIAPRATLVRSARARRRPGADRGADLPARRPLARRSGEVPAGGGGRGVAGARSDRRRLSRAAARARASTKQTLAAIERDVAGEVDAATEARKAAPAPGADDSDERRLGRRRFGMAELTYRDAVARGIAQEMERDETVVFLGEDIGAAGGVFKATVGLLEHFGPTRVRDTPISEQAILGAAMGAAMTGPAADRRDHVLRLLRRVLGHRREPDRQDALHDRRASLAAARHPTGQRRRPAVRRAAFAGGRELGDGDPRPQGRRALDRRRRDGLLAAAVRDPDPVLFFEQSRSMR